MVEEQDFLGEAKQLRRNLEETHTKMKEHLRRKLAKYFEPLLEVTSADKYHRWFALTLYPPYVNELMDVRKLHEIETFYTRTTINEIMPQVL